MASIVSNVISHLPIISTASPFVAAVSLTVVPGIFYTLAAYAHLYLPQLTLMMSILISVIFATMEYIIRVPIIDYSSKVANMSNSQLQVVWVVITLILAWLSDIFFPKKKEHTN